MSRFTGLFHRMQRKAAKPEETFLLGQGDEADIVTMMRLLPQMEKEVGISVESFEIVVRQHASHGDNSSFNRNAAAAIQRLKDSKVV